MGGKPVCHTMWYYLQPALRVVEDYHTDAEHGLTPEMADKYLVDYGPNIIPALIYKGENVMGELTNANCTVIRGGKETKVTPAAVVPGDLVRLTAGERAPADLRIVREIAGEKSAAAQISNEFYTGSTIPVNATKDAVLTTVDPFLASNMIFTASEVVRGTIFGICVGTGAHTRLGYAVHGLRERRKKKIQQKGKNFLKQLEFNGVKTITPRVGQVLDLVTAAVYDACLFIEPMAVSHFAFGVGAQGEISQAPTLSQVALHKAGHHHSTEDRSVATDIARAMVLGTTGSILSPGVAAFAAPVVAAEVQTSYPVLVDRPYDASCEYSLTVRRLRDHSESAAGGKKWFSKGRNPRRSAVSLTRAFRCGGGSLDTNNEDMEAMAEPVLVVVRGTPQVLLDSCSRFLDAHGDELHIIQSFRAAQLAHAADILAKGFLPVAFCHKHTTAREALGEAQAPRLSGGYTWVALAGFSVDPKKNCAQVGNLCRELNIKLFLVGEESYADDPTLVRLIARKIGLFLANSVDSMLAVVNKKSGGMGGKPADIGYSGLLASTGGVQSGGRVVTASQAEEMPEEDLWSIVKGRPGFQDVAFASLNSHSLELLVQFLQDENHIVMMGVSGPLSYPAVAITDVSTCAEFSQPPPATLDLRGRRQMAFADATIASGNIVTLLQAIVAIKGIKIKSMGGTPALGGAERGALKVPNICAVQ